MDESLYYVLKEQFPDFDVISIAKSFLSYVNNFDFDSFKRFVQQYLPEPSEPHSFWSGTRAREYAKKQIYKTDYSYPILCLLFEMCNILRNNSVKHDVLSTIMFSLSKIYTYQCRIKAFLYLSSDKTSESAGLTIGNNFWEAELPVLRELQLTNKIKDIVVFVYENNEWSNGISLDKIILPIRRRHFHPSDLEIKKSSYQKQKMTIKEIDDWKQSSPRSFITVYALKRMITKWKKIISINKICL